MRMRFFLTIIWGILIPAKDASFSHRQRWWWICIKTLVLPRHSRLSLHRTLKRWSQRSKYVVTTASPPIHTFKSSIHKRCLHSVTFPKSTTTRRYSSELNESQHKATTIVLKWSIMRLSISSHQTTAVMVSRQKMQLISLLSSVGSFRIGKRRADQLSTSSKRRCICSIGNYSIVATRPQNNVTVTYNQVTPPSPTNLNKDNLNKIIIRIRTKTLKIKVKVILIMNTGCTRRCSAHSF